ncbi:MAG: CapA family protein [Chitinophagales bacterium]
MKKILSFSILSLCISLGFAQQADSTSLSNDTITLIGVGDIMMGTLYPEPELPPDDGIHLYEEVDSVLQDADVTFGNLEGVLMDKNGPSKTCKDPSVCYVFRSPQRYAKLLVDAGFDVVSVANNHAGDFGDAGRLSTMRTLDSVGLQYAGQLQKQVAIFYKDGVKYGFTAFSPNSNCISVNDTASAISIVKQLDSLVDVVIVSFHGGAEGAAYQNVPKKHELFHGEDRGNVYEFAHLLVDAGADVIFGQGPHVIRSIEVYNNRFISYSAGNFCTFGGMSVNGVNGLAPIFKVFANKKGEFIKGQIIPCYQLSHTYVHLDPDKRATTILKYLTKQDFPNSGITITDDGEITYKPATE